MIDGAGGRFIGAGELYCAVDLGSQGWEGGLTGTWSCDLASDWMGAPMAGGVLTFVAEASGSHWRLEIDGSVAHTEHPIALRSVVVEADDCGAATSGSSTSGASTSGSSTAGASTWGASTSGAVRLRGATGDGYTIDLEECDCGIVTYDNGATLGEASIDLAASARSLAEWRL